jgi:hypothetical protein
MTEADICFIGAIVIYNDYDRKRINQPRINPGLKNKSSLLI